MKLFDILPVLFVRYSQGGFEMETNVEKTAERRLKSLHFSE